MTFAKCMAVSCLVVFGCVNVSGQDLVSAKAKLKEAVEHALSDHKELGEHSRLIASQVPKKNGWLVIAEICKRWEELSTQKNSGEWTTVFLSTRFDEAEACGETEKQALKVGLERTSELAKDLEKLVREYDCFVATTAVQMEDSGPLLVGGLRRMLYGRIVAMRVGGAESGILEHAVSLYYGLAVKVDLSVNLLGYLTTVGVRESTLVDVGEVLAVLSDPASLLRTLEAAKRVQYCTVQQLFTREAADTVVKAGGLLKKTDKELEVAAQDASTLHGRQYSPADLFVYMKRRLLAVVEIMDALPSSTMNMSDLEHCQLLVRVAKMSKVEGDTEIVSDQHEAGNLVRYVLLGAISAQMSDAMLRFWVEEAIGKGVSTRELLAKIVTDFLPLHFAERLSAIEVSVSNTHPIRGLFRAADRLPTRLIRPLNAAK